MYMHTGYKDLSLEFTFGQGSKAREFKTDISIWYPANPPIGSSRTRVCYTGDQRGESIVDARILPGKHKVILFSHGSHGCRDQSWRIMEDLASRGYIVAAPGHSGTLFRDRISISSYLRSLWLRPIEIYHSALLVKRVFKGKADINSVAVSGHSLGGLTSLFVAGAEPTSILTFLLNRMINVTKSTEFINLHNMTSCIVPIAPAGNWFLYRKRGIKKVKKPTLIVAGDSDFITPSVLEANPIYENIQVDKDILTLKGAGHHTFDLLADMPLAKQLAGYKGHKWASRKTASAIHGWVSRYL